MKQIILASASPRRKELLSLCTTDFICIPADIDESMNPENDLEKEITNLSFRKADAVFKDHPNALVIGSDTIVIVDQEVLGKPKDKDEAKQMLRKLSGRTHTVMTGICLRSDKRIFTDCIISQVTFDTLREEEIDTYVASGECMDKAGAYAVQGISAKFISAIHGDYYAIMGFPLHCVYKELKNIDCY